MSDKFGDLVRLQHATDAIDTIQTYMGQSTLGDFQENEMLQDACIRQLQVIGEASNKISPDFQNLHPYIPWGEIIGLRNIVIHQYASVDEKIIWDIIQNDLPPLKINLESIISSLK